MLPPAQRRNAGVRGGDCHRDAGAVHEAVQLGRRSCGAKPPRKRRDLHNREKRDGVKFGTFPGQSL